MENMMDKERIESLPQLNRIEYKLEASEIDRNRNVGTLAHLVYIIALFLGFITLCYLGLYNVSEVAATNFLADITQPLENVTITFIILGIVCDVYYILKYKKALKDLNNKYFDIHPKKCK